MLHAADQRPAQPLGVFTPQTGQRGVPRQQRRAEQRTEAHALETEVRDVKGAAVAQLLRYRFDVLSARHAHNGARPVAHGVGALRTSRVLTGLAELQRRPVAIYFPSLPVVTARRFIGVVIHRREEQVVVVFGYADAAVVGRDIVRESPCLFVLEVPVYGRFGGVIDVLTGVVVQTDVFAAVSSIGELDDGDSRLAAFERCPVARVQH